MKVGFFDIENSPHLGYTWEKYEQNVLSFKEYGFLLSFAFKWQGEKKIHIHSLPRYKGYQHNKHSDKALVKDLWKFMNEADIIVAHNGDNFDVKKANARFIKYGLKPPAPFKTVDTLKLARKTGKFPGNSLEDLLAYFSIGKKESHIGKEMWFQCMDGNMKAWRMMERYNIHDVRMLEKIYEKFVPYNPKLYVVGCPACGSDKFVKHGNYLAARNQIKERRQCVCGRWYLGNIIKK